MPRQSIVEDGRERLLADPEARKRLDQAIEEIRARYAQEARGLSLLGRARRWLRLQREIREAVERIAPSRGVYIASGES